MYYVIYIYTVYIYIPVFNNDAVWSQKWRAMVNKE